MSTWERERERIAEVGRIFDVDHRGAELEILQDDGVHRHLRFRRPGTSIGYFNLTTWPGHLAISGDVEAFVFAREHDMFGFFGSNRERINPTYWAEKVQAGRDQLTTYSESLTRQQVLEAFTEAVKAGRVPKGLGKAIRQDILEDWDFAHEETVRRLLSDFQYGTRYSIWCTERTCRQKHLMDTYAQAERWGKEHYSEHPGHVTDPLPVAAFKFDDIDEWTLTDWSHHYLYALHAITWGIGRYRARKAMPPRLWAKHGRS